MNRPGTSSRPAPQAFAETRKSRLRQGFTLAELMAVIAIMTVLSAILLPALNKGRTRSQAISCMNNMRQLQIAWLMFPDDHNSELAGNNYVDGIKIGSAQTYMGESWAPGNPKHDFTSANIERGHLFPYNRNASIYHCPADKSLVELPTGGEPILRTRSYGMSSSMNSQISSRFPSFRKQNEMSHRNTARLFVFIDSHEDSITDGHFGVNPRGPDDDKRWVNLPAAKRHGRASNLSFADGHIERWSWKADKEWTGWNKQASGDDLLDLRRLQSAIHSD